MTVVRGDGSRQGGVTPPDVPTIGLASATTLNMLSMIGAGPFLTIPLIIQSMQGPQSLVAWVVGATVALADGLVWPSSAPRCHGREAGINTCSRRTDRSGSAVS